MTHKIKSEDKAALLSRMEKAGTPIANNQITDNKLEGYFEININNPKQQENFKTILNQSPKINIVKEMENKKKMSKDKLKEMIRQELVATLAEKKKMKDEDKKEKLDENEQLDESLMGMEGIVAGLIGLGIPLATIIAGFVKAAKEKGGAAAAEELRKAIDASKGN